MFTAHCVVAAVVVTLNVMCIKASMLISVSLSEAYHSSGRDNDVSTGCYGNHRHDNNAGTAASTTGAI